MQECHLSGEKNCCGHLENGRLQCPVIHCQSDLDWHLSAGTAIQTCCPEDSLSVPPVGSHCAGGSAVTIGSHHAGFSDACFHGGFQQDWMRVFCPSCPISELCIKNTGCSFVMQHEVLNNHKYFCYCRLSRSFSQLFPVRVHVNKLMHLHWGCHGQYSHCIIIWLFDFGVWSHIVAVFTIAHLFNFWGDSE